MDGRKRPRDEDGNGGASEAGEISMSIEETNKLRISLGLKPLSMGSSAATQAEEASRRHKDKEKQKEQEERAEKFKAMQHEKKKQRAQDAFLDVKGLGEADEDDPDDMQSWVEKSRVAEVAKRAEERYAKRQAEAEAARKRERQQAGEDEEGSKYTSADLAGMKVRSDYTDLIEGETMVLTLADRRIINDKGQLVEEDDDELVNVQKAEDKARKKAREAAAPKAKPLWEEDGKRRGLLDKYDEEEQDMVLQLGADGTVGGSEAKRLEEMRKKLAEGAGKLDNAAVGVLDPKAPAPAAAGSSKADYLTEADLAASKASKEERKKKRKERKIRAKSAEPEQPQEQGDTGSLIAQLEAQAAAGDGSNGAPSELGSRAGRMTAREKDAAALRESEAAKRARFEAAVSKGNWASLALKAQPQEVKKEEVLGDDEDADRELQESLARARRLAAANKPSITVKSESAMDEDSKAPAEGSAPPRSTVEEIALAAARAREEEEKQLRERLAEERGRKGSGVLVNDTMEFVRNIQALPGQLGGQSVLAPGMASTVLAPPPPGGPPGSNRDDDDDKYMDIDDEEGVQEAEGASGRWVSTDETGAESGAAATAGGGGKGGRQFRRKGGADDGDGGSGDGEDDKGPKDSGVGEAAVGKGLAGALALLKERGELTAESKMIWAGRNNDRSKNALQGLVGENALYTGGSHEDHLARSVEMALTQKDEFGRVMTPKERFRKLCHNFHGIFPSRNREEQRVKKAQQELARRQHASSEVVEKSEVVALTKVTEKAAQPFVVLQGKGAMESLRALNPAAAGSMAPPPPKKPAASKAAGSSKPAGNLTPMLGDSSGSALRKPPPADGVTTVTSRLPRPPGGPPGAR